MFEKAPPALLLVSSADLLVNDVRQIAGGRRRCLVSLSKIVLTMIQQSFKGQRSLSGRSDHVLSIPV